MNHVPDEQLNAEDPDHLHIEWGGDGWVIVTHDGYTVNGECYASYLHAEADLERIQQDEEDEHCARS